MIYLVMDYLTVFIEIMCCKIFFDTFCKLKEENITAAKYFMPILLSICGCSVVWFFQNNFFIKQLGIIAVTTIIMKWYNQKTWKRNFILSIIYQSILLVADYIVIICYSNLLTDIDFTSHIIQFLIVILAKSILFLIVVLIKKIFDKKGMVYFDDSQWIKFLFFPVFTICVLTAMLPNFSFSSVQKQEELFCMIAVGLVGMNIVVFYLLKDVAQREKKIHENMLFEIQAKNQLQLYETVLSDSEKQRKLAHEYKNKLACIQALCETKQYEDLRLYLQNITEEVLHDLDCINTNHAIVNAVLNAKYQEAVAKGIVVVCKISDMSMISLDAQDLVLLLSNILNNAIEACEKNTVQEKMIKLKLVHENNNFIFSVRNTYDGRIAYNDGILQTTKTNSPKNHGIGIQNVIKVIEKNNGYYVIEPTSQEFYISVIIPQDSTQ